MQAEPSLSENESLRIIHDMINATKSSFQEDGFLYLFWGWLIVFCCLVHYVLLVVTSFPHPYVIWVAMPAAGFTHVVYLRRRNRRRSVRTYAGEFMAFLWMGFMISVSIVLAMIPKLTFEHAYPVIILFYGTATFASGGALRYKPLIIGSILNWPLAIISFFMPFHYQLLLLALAVFCGYIIPGYLLKADHRSRNVG
jgi:hypothetical protein